MSVTPIQTRYRGYRFRSRLEARWAVFFDAVDLQYEYEPQGYVLEDLGDAWYLPDFWLPTIGPNGMWAEVKADRDNWIGADLMLALCSKHTRFAGTILGPVPYAAGGWPSYDEADETDGWALYFYGGVDRPYFWCACPKCGRVGFEWRGLADRVTCGCYPPGVVRMHTASESGILRAYEEARGARFEHGERGGGMS
jgi:hypothetical protein